MGVFKPTKIDWSDAIERVVWTAIETFIGAVSIGAFLDEGISVVVAGAVAAASSAISVVKNIVKQRLSELSASGPSS